MVLYQHLPRDLDPSKHLKVVAPQSMPGFPELMSETVKDQQ